MRSSKINYVIVGVFVIAMGVALITMLLTLSGGPGATDPYYAVYRNVTGVQFGTQVLYEGYPIGQVEEVTPIAEGAGMRFRVDFNITRGRRIPSDSIATIAAPGLLAAITISISEGASGTSLKPGDHMVSQEAQNLFSVFASVAADVQEITQKDLKPLLVSLNKAVMAFGDILGDEGEALVRDLEVLAGDLARRVPGIVDDVEVLSGQLLETSGQMQEIFSPKNREKLERIIARAESATGNINEFSGELRATRKRIDQLLESMDNMLIDNKLDVEQAIIDLRHVVDSVARHIDSLNQNMDGAARNMNEFTRQIRQNPGLLLGGSPPQGEAAVAE